MFSDFDFSYPYDNVTVDSNYHDTLVQFHIYGTLNLSQDPDHPVYLVFYAVCDEFFRLRVLQNSYLVLQSNSTIDPYIEVTIPKGYDSGNYSITTYIRIHTITTNIDGTNTISESEHLLKTFTILLDNFPQKEEPSDDITNNNDKNDDAAGLINNTDFHFVLVVSLIITVAIIVYISRKIAIKNQSNEEV